MHIQGSDCGAAYAMIGRSLSAAGDIVPAARSLGALMNRPFALSSLALFATACAPYPEGLRATPPGDGPEVRVDWDAEPLPDIPYPNDLATTVDRHSPTGLRLNVSIASNTWVEEKARIKINELYGFGIYSPIAVGFSKPLDLDNLANRHALDPKVGAEQFSDDAVFLIDITPGSPEFQQLIPIDMGQGRYPMDAANGDRYFANDTRAGHPSVIFDTVDEDLNGNGVLDWGEDTDNDGTLDKPNVYPEGAEDVRENLLSWYERETDTLIFRPVRPLREMTTYAVVVTERTVGEDGTTVRSPWEYVHHLRQTEALAPVPDALSQVGLGLEDIAYAWTYTTGSITADLVNVRRGLKGEGPLASLDGAFPEGIEESLPTNDIAGGDPVNLEVSTLMETLTTLGLFSGDSAEALVSNYTAFGDRVVGGSFTTPNFFGDIDHGPAPWPLVDDHNDYWQVDSYNNHYEARAERVPFTCVLPRGVEQPAPVVQFGHGYGSSRFDFLGFAWAMNRMGMAACAFDYPGHGPTLDPEETELILAVLEPTGLMPFYEHLLDSRYRDLDYDGVMDSGGDQWSADAFHTRDMVRQAAVDHAQFIDSLMACGETSWDMFGGGTGVSCDWDGDGTPDIGGPDNDYTILGGSLGGINTAVAAGVIDEVQAWAPVVPGGGLLDVAFRTEIGGAVEAMHGRLMSPLILGLPTEEGTLQVVQLVNTVMDMEVVPIATLTDFPAGGRIVVENLANGVVHEGYIPEDGSFRVGIPADAASPWEKAQIAGAPAEGFDAPLGDNPSPYTIDDPTLAGDALVIRLETEDGQVVHELDTWEAQVTFQGVNYPAGSTLVAAAEGLGHIRATPEVRRIGFVFSAILEPGDPIAYARGFSEEPLPGTNGKPRNMLIMPTPGDTIVNASTGIALARAAGWLPDEVDPRYGMSIDQWLVERKVIQGLEQYGPYVCANGEPCLFDADDLDRGYDGTDAPSEAPLRVSKSTSSGVSGLRLPYVSQRGSHGFVTPRPSDPFDIATFATMQIAVYFKSGGTVLSDALCLEDASCEGIPQLPEDSVGGDR
jgi:hypothetical protein